MPKKLLRPSQRPKAPLIEPVTLAIEMFEPQQVMENLRFSPRWLCKIPSSEMSHRCLGRVRTDIWRNVSLPLSRWKESAGYEQGEQWLATESHCEEPLIMREGRSSCLLEPHGVTVQKTTFFIVTSVRNLKSYIALTGRAL
jgi:hypothetical protein